MHLTFELAPELSTEAARLGPPLSTVPHVDVVAPDWLHLTMTGVGFTDAVGAGTLRSVADAVFDRVPSLSAEPLAFQRLFLGREGLSLVAEPSSWLAELKSVQESAALRALGLDSRPAAPFHPHVSLAYFSGEVDVTALTRTLELASPRPVVVDQPMVSLIELGRDEQAYTWRVLAQRRLRS